MQSDSDSYVAPGARQQQQVEEEDEEAKDAPQIESGLSGTDELGDDDFWG